MLHSVERMKRVPTRFAPGLVANCAMASPAPPWVAAVDDVVSVLSDLDEQELEGAIADGQASFRLVEILLEQMPGRHIPK